MAVTHNDEHAKEELREYGKSVSSPSLSTKFEIKGKTKDDIKQVVKQARSNPQGAQKVPKSSFLPKEENS